MSTNFGHLFLSSSFPHHSNQLLRLHLQYPFRPSPVIALPHAHSSIQLGSPTIANATISIDSWDVCVIHMANIMYTPI